MIDPCTRFHDALGTVRAGLSTPLMRMMLPVISRFPQVDVQRFADFLGQFMVVYHPACTFPTHMWNLRHEFRASWLRGNLATSRQVLPLKTVQIHSPYGIQLVYGSSRSPLPGFMASATVSEHLITLWSDIWVVCCRLPFADILRLKHYASAAETPPLFDCLMTLPDEVHSPSFLVFEVALNALQIQQARQGKKIVRNIDLMTSTKLY
jgi:hypothetical protein